MPRPRRINRPDLIYHVINRGNNRQVLFADEADYRYYLGLLKRYKDKFEFQLFAYCLMNNHIHLLIRTVSERGSITRIMNALTIAYVRYYQRSYAVSGHVWQGRFKSPLVSDDEYLLAVMRYIEQNPVRAGIVKHTEEYVFSSYNANVRIEDNILVDKGSNPVYLTFGDTPEVRARRYKEFAGNLLDEDKLKAIRSSLNGHGQYVSEKFQTQIEQLLAIKRRRGRGRPRKGINT